MKAVERASNVEAFTALELAIIVAILGLLAAVLPPALIRSIRFTGVAFAPSS